MSTNQQQLIKQYFNSLAQEFITDPKHKDITIVFSDYLGGSLHGDTLGNSQRNHTWTDQETTPGSGVYKKAPGSAVYKYTISFLNNFKGTDQLRGTVVHEFSHLYLYSKSDNSHTHDDTFYSKMDQFENWLDKHYGLSPRKDKGGDWNQHVDYNKRNQRKAQYPNQTNQSQNDNDYYSPPPRYRDTPEGKEKEEWFRLSGLIRDSKTLTELENNWQTIKNSPLYSSSKKTFENSKEDNKAELDKTYNTYKGGFCTSCLNKKENHQSNCPNKCSKCNDSRLRNDSEKCHNIDCENYCFDPKWDRDKQSKRSDDTSSQDILTIEESEEYNRLARLIKSSQDLAELEKNYQIIKNSSIYGNKRYRKQDKDDVKTEFDEGYESYKKELKDKGGEHQEEKNNPSPSSEPNDSGRESNPLIWLSVIGIVALFLIMILIPKKRK